MAIMQEKPQKTVFEIEWCIRIGQDIQCLPYTEFFLLLHVSGMVSLSCGASMQAGLFSQSLIKRFEIFGKPLRIPLNRYNKKKHVKLDYVLLNVVCLVHNYLIFLIGLSANKCWHKVSKVSLNLV